MSDDDDDEGDLFADDDSGDDEVVVSPKKKPAAAAAAAKKKDGSDGDDDSSDDDSDSDDTAELFSRAATKSKQQPRKKAAAAAKKQPPPKKKAALPPPKAVVAKKKKDDSDDDDDEDDDGGLFDSSDDDSDAGKKKPKAKASAASASKQPQSRRERLEALAKKKRVDENDNGESSKKKSSSRNKDSARSNKHNKDDDDDKEKGYESAESMDSAQFQRTKEDDDFLDTTGEDADAVQELYAEQHFDDEEEDMEDNGPGKNKKKRRYNNSSGGSREDYGKSGDGEEPDNPIMAAVHRMKKKKLVKRSLTEMEDEAKAFLSRMELAAEQDEALMAERKPATRKLQMLNEVVDMLNRKDMQRTLLELDVLVVCKRWIQPLPNGTLGNVTVRQRLLSVIAEMKGDNGITPNDLKRSEFGKVVMILFKHPSETPTLKRQCKALVEQWSRPIFQKSGNMRDLERVHHLRGESTGGLASIRRQQAQVEASAARAAMQQQRSRTGGGPASSNKDLQSIIASGKQGGTDQPASANRVRVPFSKGFAFSVRPEMRADVQQQRAGAAGGGGGGAAKGLTSPPKDGNRGKLSKRMLEKSRTKAKNQRSANISVEGRRTKG